MLHRGPVVLSIQKTRGIMTKEDINTLELPVDMVVDTCAECGVKFGAPKHFIDTRKTTHNTFYCPNGHSLHYTARSYLDEIKTYKEALEKIQKIEVGGLFNKNSLELAIEIARGALK